MAFKYPPTKKPPWNHQFRALETGHHHPGFYYAKDMGTGKTKTVIDDLNGHDCHIVLVLCPKSVVQVWPGEFDKHSYHDFKVITIKDYRKSWKHAKKADKIKSDLETAIATNKRVCLVLNYDAIIRPAFGTSRHPVSNRIMKTGLLFKFNWDMVILDESHRAKAINSLTSWMCKYLGERTPLRRCLSGTPMPHSPLDIYAQFRFLDQSVYGTTAAGFKARYAILGGFDMKQIVAWQHIKELHDKFDSLSFRVKKNEVLDLPPTMHEERRCDISASAMRIYKELANEFIAQVGMGEISVDNALVKLLRLSQIASGYVQLDDGTHKIECDSKINTLKEILTDLDPGEPVVIICRFRQEITRIKNLLVSMGRIPGEQSGAMHQWQSFQDFGKRIDELYDTSEERKQNRFDQARQDNLDSIVVQIQSGSLGLELTRACYCVFFSIGFSLGDYEQALARVDRPGQTRPVTYYHIIANGTVDVTTFQAMQFKKIVVEYVLSNVKAILATKKILTSKGVLR